MKGEGGAYLFVRHHLGVDCVGDGYIAEVRRKGCA